MPQPHDKKILAYLRHKPGNVDMLHVTNRGRYVIVKIRMWKPDQEEYLTPYEAKKLYNLMQPLRPFRKGGIKNDGR